MITGVHAMIYSPQAEAIREFFRDKLQMPFYDAGEGWLIFTPPAGEIGCHPNPTTHHEISLYCDDIHATVAALKERGVAFSQEVEDHGYGLVTFIEAPGELRIQLYEPRHARP